MNLDVKHLFQLFDLNRDEYLEFLHLENAQGQPISRVEFNKIILSLIERIVITKRQTLYLLNPSNNNSPFIELRRCDQKLLQEVAMRTLEVITALRYPSDQERLIKALLRSNTDSKLV